MSFQAGILEFVLCSFPDDCGGEAPSWCSAETFFALSLRKGGKNGNS